MKSIQVYKKDTEEIITSLTENDDGTVYGITGEDYAVIVDGEELETKNEKLADAS